MTVRNVFVAICLLFVPAFVLGQTQKKNEPVAEWEYKQLYSASDEVLNKHAREGWEVIAASGAGSENSYSKVILKRHRTHPFFGIAQPDLSQVKSPAQPPKCKLSLVQAPVIRGLRLGMTSEEIFALFPSNERAQFDRTQQLKSAEFAPFYGHTTFDFYPSNHETKERFAGIATIKVGMLDGKVVSLDFRYMNVPQFENRMQLYELVTRQLNLPDVNEWPAESRSNSSALLPCDGFTFQVSYFGQQLALSLTDPSYTKIVNDRQRADLAKKRGGFKL